MTNKFSRRFKEICNEINRVVPSDQVVERLYNVHKRSLPVSLDRIVITGATKSEAREDVKRLARNEQKRRNAENLGIYFYFDILPMDAKSLELNVFYNEGSPVL